MLLRKKIIILCFFAGTVYLSFICLAFSFRANSPLSYVSTTTTTTPTPMIVLMNVKQQGLKDLNITIEKYDALKVHTNIMKRKIKKMTQRIFKPNSNITQVRIINEDLHFFYSDFSRDFHKNIKNLNVSKNASRDIVEQNLKAAQIIGAGVIFVTCPKLSHSLISQTSRGHSTLMALFDQAPTYNMKVSIAIKDYAKRNVMSIKRDIRIFLSMYGDKHALYKIKKPENSWKLPVIYIMDSFNINSKQWAEVLSDEGHYTIRNTAADAVVLGQVREDIHVNLHIRLSHFDGFFTCCDMNGETFGSTWKNWLPLSRWAEKQKLMWSAGAVEGTGGLPVLSAALRVALNTRPRPRFVSISNVRVTNELVAMTQTWLQKWVNTTTFLNI